MKPVFGISLSLCLAASAAAQLPLPNYSNTYSSSRTRGFFFKTPVPFVLTHVQVPDEKNYGKQMVAIYKLSAPPPAYSKTVNVSPLFFTTGVDSKKIIPIKPLIFAKDDYVAVLGACGPNAGTVHNSYGSGSYKSAILGQPITLSRCLIQANLAAVKGVYGMSSEGNGPIGRVRLFVVGHGRAEPYGSASGRRTTPPPQLAVSDPAPPSIGTTAAMILKPGTATNTGGVLAIGTKRSNIPIGIGTLLNSPPLLILGVSGPIPTTGSAIKFPIPNDSNLLGVKATFQAAMGVTGGAAFTNGLEWTAGK